MAISYAVSFTFSPSTTISSSQVNTNFSDNANTWNGIEAKTKTFSNLGVDTELKSGGTVSTANGTVAAPAITFTNSTGSGLYRIGADDIGIATAGVLALEINNTQQVTAAIKGVSTNSVPAAGMVGEYIESVVNSVNAPTSTQFGDITSISLTAGDWDVSLNIYIGRNSAGLTLAQIGISTTTGNSQTGLSTGSNLMFFNRDAGSTGIDNAGLTVASYRMLLSATTTVYAKMEATYSSGTPQFTGRLSARRMR